MSSLVQATNRALAVMSPPNSYPLDHNTINGNGSDQRLGERRQVIITTKMCSTTRAGMDQVLRNALSSGIFVSLSVAVMARLAQTC